MITMKISKMMMLILSLIMIYLNNPVKVSVALLGSSLLLFGMISKESGQVWFPLLFSMLFMGGILMMFMILSSVAPNEKSMKFNIPILTVVLGSTLLLGTHKIAENSEAHKVPKSILESGATFSLMVLILILYFFSAITVLCKVETPMRNLICCE